MTIIGLSGYAGAGKDTVGEILVRHHGFRRVAFADRLKALALDLNPVLDLQAEHMRVRATLSEIISAHGGDLDVAKREVPSVREYLQDLGVKVRIHLGEDTWVRAALRGTAGEDIVVTDCRFRNEADAIRETKGMVWRVERPGYAPVNAHISERDLDGYGFDAYVGNAGSLVDLEAQVAGMLGYAGVR